MALGRTLLPVCGSGCPAQSMTEARQRGTFLSPPLVLNLKRKPEGNFLVEMTSYFVFILFNFNCFSSQSQALASKTSVGLFDAAVDHDLKSFAEKHRLIHH